MREHLGEHIKDVRTTERLQGSPVCLVADDTDMDINLQRILQQHNQLKEAMPRILEVNPRHDTIKALAKVAVGDGGLDALADPAHLLLDHPRGRRFNAKDIINISPLITIKIIPPPTTINISIKLSTLITPKSTLKPKNKFYNSKQLYHHHL